MTTAERPPGTRRARARRGEGERLREEILDATERLLFEAGDAEAVSIRAVARTVGVTPPAIYLHFSDKTELIFEVCQRIWDRFDDHLRAAVAEIDEPLAWLETIGRAYVDWGLANPEPYRILFMGRPQDVPDDVDKVEVIMAGVFGDLVAQVTRAVDGGAMYGDPTVAAFQAWICVHGLTSLLISVPEMPWPERAAMVDATIATVFAAGGAS